MIWLLLIPVWYLADLVLIEYYGNDSVTIISSLIFHGEMPAPQITWGDVTFTFDVTVIEGMSWSEFVAENNGILMLLAAACAISYIVYRLTYRKAEKEVMSDV
jgi:hypothetical protein